MERARLSQVWLGIRFEIITVIWMAVEMAVPIGAGLAAGSALLIAFGVESLIELVGGGILLCGYVLVSAALGLMTRSRPETSPPGIVVSAVAVLGMPLLAYLKRRVATRIDSDALAADAVNSITCGYMAGTVLIGLVANAAFGWWWAESIAALVFLAWLLRETVEAFEAAREGSETEEPDHGQ